MAVCFAAVDAGTTSVKAGVFDETGHLLAMASRSVLCDFHDDGRIGQDANRLRAAAFSALRQAVANSRVGAAQIGCLCLTNQRATVLVADAAGRPLGPAISWQDMRGERAMRALRRTLGADGFTGWTGLPLSAIFTIGKLLQLRREAHGRPLAADCRVLLIQDFLLRAFGAREWVCDRSNASLTGLLDSRAGEWSETLLNAAGVARDQLPALVGSGVQVGRIDRAASRCGLLPGTPLISGAGDQQCAGIGCGAIEPGMGSLTLGTCGVVMVCVPRAVEPPAGLMCTAHGMPGAWCLEGLVPSAFDSVRWAADLNGRGRRIDRAMQRRIEAVAPGSDGVLFWPYLLGAGAPHWRAEARAAWLGLARGHGLPTMLRAVLEGVAFEIKAILDAFAGCGVPARRLRVNGGGCGLPPWSRLQASVYGLELETVRQQQATLLGAAMLGAVGIGAAGSLADACARMVRVAETFQPDAAWEAVYRDVFQRHQRLGRMVRRPAERRG